LGLNLQVDCGAGSPQSRKSFGEKVWLQGMKPDFLHEEKILGRLGFRLLGGHMVRSDPDSPGIFHGLGAHHQFSSPLPCPDINPKQV
jgi:hypothetical protein